MIEASWLLGQPITAALTTELGDGRLQATPVWFTRRADTLLVSTMREFAKARNLRHRPRATLLVVDPANTSSWVEVRAEVTLVEDDAVTVLDDITEQYCGTRPYFGAVVPAELAATEHPVTCVLAPVRVRTPPPLLPVDAPRPSPAPPPPVPSLATTRPCADAALPADHLDLLDSPVVAALATRLPSGYAQTQPVWFSRDGNDLLVNTLLQRRKGRNLLADPRATLLVVDPADSGRWVEIRADVDLATDGAELHLDRLTRAYSEHEHYYGGIVPTWQQDTETRVIARLHPRAIHCDAVHR